MTAAACADLVQRGDPDRWRTAMVAPPECRAGLMALYAFNLEVSRAPWVVSDPILGDIRLRWWADCIAEIYEGAPLRRHEVVAPLAETIREAELPRAPFDALIAARAWDGGTDPHADRSAFDAYVDATAAGLMWLAARHLGARAVSERTVRDVGWAAGSAALLVAAPVLYARGRSPVPVAGALDRRAVGRGETPSALAEAVQAIATAGLARLARARVERRAVDGRALAALLPAASAGDVLATAAARPEAMLAGRLAPSDARARATRLWRAITGRW